MHMNNVVQDFERQRKVELQAFKHQIVELENCFEDRFQTMKIL